MSCTPKYLSCMAKHGTAENQTAALHLSSLQALALQPHLLPKVWSQVHVCCQGASAAKAAPQGLSCALWEPESSCSCSAVGVQASRFACESATPLETCSWKDTCHSKCPRGLLPSCLGTPIKPSWAMLLTSSLLSPPHCPSITRALSKEAFAWVTLKYVPLRGSILNAQLCKQRQWDVRSKAVAPWGCQEDWNHSRSCHGFICTLAELGT